MSKFRAIQAVISVLLCVPGCNSSSESSKEKEPVHNVLLVSIDTLRADKVGCYAENSKQSLTPHIDKIAQEGVLFENCVTTSPWTTPAHASLLTAKYPSAHGVTSSFSEIWQGIFGERSGVRKLEEREVTIAELLLKRGYRTAAFTAGGPLSKELGFDQGFEVYDETMFKLDADNVGRLKAWIEANKDERFFVFWHHFEVHAPYLNVDRIKNEKRHGFGGLVSELEALNGGENKEIWPNKASRKREEQVGVLVKHGMFDLETCEALYDGGVMKADEWLGNIVRFLKKNKLYENTLIVVTSDHGEEFGEHNEDNFYNKHGHSMYDEMIMVPLVIKLPKGEDGGKRVAGIASIVDVMPTILDVLGYKWLSDGGQGESLRTVWEGANRRKGMEFIESTSGLSEMKSVRTNDLKYIVSISEKQVAIGGRNRMPKHPRRFEFYNLDSDIEEQKNLLVNDASNEILKQAFEMDIELRKHLDEINEGNDIENRRIEVSDDVIEKLESLGYLERNMISGP